MKKITKEFEVFSYSELSEEAKEKAINEEITADLELIPFEEMSPNMQKAVNTAERLQTPWFTGGYIWDYAKSEILENLNQYEYLKDGSIFVA